MRNGWLFALVVGVACMNVGLVVADKTPSAKSMVIADFQDNATFGRVRANDGVKLSLTNPDPVDGRQWLEVRIGSFSTHNNQWPSVSLGSEFFTKPLDASRYSRLSVPINNVTEGLRSVQVYWCSQADHDGGRRLEGDGFLIPGGTTWDCEVPTGSFEVNDPSSLVLFMIQFPPVESETVYRIGPIQAVYDPAVGCPAEKIQTQAQDLRTKLDTLTGKINWMGIPQAQRHTWKQKLSGLETQVQQVARAVGQAGTPAFQGKLKTTRETIDNTSSRMGEFLFADKSGFVAWRIDPYINIVKNQYPDFSSATVDKFHVQMAGNEFRGTTFMVSPCGRDLKLTVTVEPGEGLAASAVEVFETRYLKNRRNQVTGEPLYPMDSPLAIPRDESRQITLRFNTRTQAVKPGAYSFNVVLRGEGIKKETVIPGRLVVWDFALPAYDVLPNNGYAELDSSEFYQDKLLALAVADMKIFGMNIITVYPSEMPKITELDAADNIKKVNSQLFQSRVSQVVNAWRAAPGPDRLQLMLSISGMHDLGVKDLDKPLPNPRWQKVLNQWVKMLEATLAKYGLTCDDWFMAVGDEASEAALINLEIPCAEGLKAADPRIRLVNNTSSPTMDPGMTQRFYKAFDILQPHLPGFKSGAVLREWIQKAGKPIRVYQCLCDNGALGKNPYAYYRVYGWDLVKYGLVGNGIWTYCAQAHSQVGAGCIMIYKHADRDQVLHSRRFEFYREGGDDYRYVWKLRAVAKGRGPAAVKSSEALIQEAVTDVTGHPLDSTLADRWRVKIGETILQLQGK